MFGYLYNKIRAFYESIAICTLPIAPARQTSVAGHGQTLSSDVTYNRLSLSFVRPDLIEWSLLALGRQRIRKTKRRPTFCTARVGIDRQTSAYP
jgi:hypothetical protein